MSYAEQESLESTKERISAEEKNNELYNANINLRNNLDNVKTSLASDTENRTISKCVFY